MITSGGWTIEIGWIMPGYIVLLWLLWEHSLHWIKFNDNLWWTEEVGLRVFGSLGVLWFLIGSYCLRLVTQSLWGQVNSVQSKFRKWELSPPGSSDRNEQGKELVIDCASIEWQVLIISLWISFFNGWVSFFQRYRLWLIYALHA